MGQIEKEIEDLKEELKKLEESEKFILKRKPSWLDIILSLGKAWKEWKKDYDECIRKQEEVFKQKKNKEKENKECEKDCDCLKKEKQTLMEKVKAIDSEQKQIEKKVNSFKVKYTIQEIHKSQDEKDRELTSPWHIKEWRELRAKIFLSALKLHKAFLIENRAYVEENLRLVEEWLESRVWDEYISELALMTLSLIVPVISTTFASVGRMLKKIGSESIGWLLIDEAGQALPHHAIGAIYRAKRVIVVGDPKQLEPVTTLSSGFIDAISEYYDIQSIFKKLYSASQEVNKVIWRPDVGSCQVLADYANNVGTKLGNDWVGSPLRVHRRCLNPMFDISNKVAYEEMMIYELGNKSRSLNLMEPCWIDVKGETFDKDWYHWCEEEGEVLI